MNYCVLKLKQQMQHTGTQAHLIQQVSSQINSMNLNRTSLFHLIQNTLKPVITV